MTAVTLNPIAIVSPSNPAQSLFPAPPLAGIKDARSMEQEKSRSEDDALVDRARTGDAAAFDALIVKYSPRLYSLVYNMTANHEDTDDLLQEVWSKAYRSIGGFRGKSQFYTWVHSIAANRTLNFLKKRGLRRTLSLDDVDNGVLQDKDFVELQATSTPVRETDLGEMQRRINEAMMHLTPEHRAVVTMFDVQGMPHSDIAKILGVSDGTVRSRLHYAHQQLQAWLSEFAPTSSTTA